MSEKKSKNEENDKVEDLLSKTLKNTYNTFALSVMSKVVNLFCNIVLARHISKNAYGIVKIYLEFAFLLIINFPRETIRKTSQKFCTDKDKNKEKNKYYIICKIYSLLVSFMCFISILLYFGLILFGHENFKNYKIHLLLYICSAIWEFFAEPIVIYMNLNLENKQLAITIGNFSRVISNVLFAVLFGLDVWSFTLSRICGTLCYTGYLFYLGFFKYKINLKEFALPNLKEFFNDNKINGYDISEVKEILFSFLKVTSLKMILTNCEKVLLSFVLKQSNEEKGEYSFIVDNFSFFQRFLLEPIEETFYNLTNKVKNMKNKKNEGSLAFNVLRLFIKFELIFATLLISYFYLGGIELVELVYSKKWANNATKKIGRIYSVYISICAINGIVEAFANATNDNEQMSQTNYLLIINSGLVIFFMYIFSQIDITGLIIANALCMLIRITGHIYIIFYFKSINKKGEKKRNLIADIIYFFKECYISLFSIMGTVGCLFLGFMLKKSFVNRHVIYCNAIVGFVGLINLLILYIVENKKIRTEIQHMKID